MCTSLIIFVKSTSNVDEYKYKHFCLVNKTDYYNNPVGLNYTDALKICKRYGTDVSNAHRMHYWQLANFRSDGERFLVDDGFSHAHIPRLTAWVSGILNETSYTWSNTTSWFKKIDLINKKSKKSSPIGEERTATNQLVARRTAGKESCASVSFGGEGSHVCTFVTGIQKRVFRRIHITHSTCNATQFGNLKLNRHALCESFSDDKINIATENMKCISILNTDLSINGIFEDTAMIKTTHDIASK